MKKVILTLMVIIITLVLLSCDDSTNHVGEAKTPSGSSIQKGRMLEEVIQDFEEKGFKNIKMVVLDDLITGWLTKDGEVESVSVDGNINYSSDKWYSDEVEVIITYHTFPIDDENEDEDRVAANDIEDNVSNYIEERTQRNGFDANSNYELGFDGFIIQLPQYFENEVIDKGFYQAYAQEAENITMINIAESYDDTDTVSYELLISDSQGLFESVTSMFDDVKLLNAETYKTFNTKGLLFQYKFSYNNIESIGYHYCFPIYKSNKWGYVNIYNSLKSDYAYDQDLKKILNSISLTNSTVNSSSNPIVNSVSDLLEAKEDLQSENIITAENSDEFEKLLVSYDYSFISKFASSYKGRTIQFDGNIANMMYHGSYKTRYDILIYSGDYSTTSAPGPSFKFEDVNIINDLKLTGDNIPDSIKEGQNFRFTAEILYFDYNSGLFFLKPVKTEVR